MSKILVIDDDLRLAASVKELLQETGWEVYTAATAEEARAFNNAIEFKAVLSDWDLGYAQPNGGQLVEELRSYKPLAIYIIWSGLDRTVPRDVLFYSKMDFADLLGYLEELNE